ncbi:hypothetical protein I2483_13745 [Sporosarcina sp. E16_3]|uniref:hypothetical protein n=1 Tax=Sporosarcina sp. E16_3 TaxID=2789293 RepID=UPI001A91246F|nr:hypothetical protein [Sporosarcina sp. E16_3]MBO0602726.1 hypothetical protein [Sporosarcina sp. E16_3]
MLGTTSKEVSDKLKELFYTEAERMILRGERPSIDRIDPYGHYEEGNIRLITAEQNTPDGETMGTAVRVTSTDGSTVEYKTILTAANQTGSSRSTIRKQLNGYPKFNKRGLKFERVV